MAVATAGLIQLENHSGLVVVVLCVVGQLTGQGNKPPWLLCLLPPAKTIQRSNACPGQQLTVLCSPFLPDTAVFWQPPCVTQRPKKCAHIPFHWCRSIKQDLAAGYITTQIVELGSALITTAAVVLEPHPIQLLRILQPLIRDQAMDKLRSL